MGPQVNSRGQPKGPHTLEMGTLGGCSSGCEQLGVGRKGSISGSASAHFFRRDGNERVATQYSSPLCKSSLHGIHDSVSHPISLSFPVSLNPNLDWEKGDLDTQPQYVKTRALSLPEIHSLFSVTESLALGLGCQNTKKLGLFVTCARNFQQSSQFCAATIICVARSKTAQKENQSQKENQNKPPDFNRIAIIVAKMLTCLYWILCIDVFNAA